MSTSCGMLVPFQLIAPLSQLQIFRLKFLVGRRGRCRKEQATLLILFRKLYVDTIDPLWRFSFIICQKQIFLMPSHSIKLYTGLFSFTNYQASLFKEIHKLIYRTRSLRPERSHAIQLQIPTFGQNPAKNPSDPLMCNLSSWAGRKTFLVIPMFRQLTLSIYMPKREVSSKQTYLFIFCSSQS